MPNTSQKDRARKAPDVYDEPKVQYAQPVDSVRVNEMLAIAARNAEAYDGIKQILTPYFVASLSPAQQCFWKALHRYTERGGELPTKAAMFGELVAYIREHQGTIVDEDADEAEGLLVFAFDKIQHGSRIVSSKVHAETARRIGREFVRYNAVRRVSGFLMSGHAVASDPLPLVEELQTDIMRADAVGAELQGEPFPDGWDAHDKLNLISTGCEVLDDFTGGGLIGGELLLFMAPMGVCKTTLACHMAAEKVAELARPYAQGTCPKRDDVNLCGKVFLIFTEGSKRDYRYRLLAHLGRVPWKRLQHTKIDKLVKTGGQATTPETMYEARFNDDKETFKTEYQRVKDALTLFNRHLVLVDCTESNEDDRFAGKGGMAEIAGKISTYLRGHKDTYPSMVILDHASALANRIIDGDFERLRHVLKDIPLKLGQLVKKYDVPGIVMHQLSGVANSKGVAADYHHTDAAETKSMAEFVDFAAVCGRLDGEQYGVFRLTKHRRMPPQDHVVVRVDGEFNAVVVSANHYFDEAGRKIVDRTMDRKVYGQNGEVKPKRAASDSRVRQQVAQAALSVEDEIDEAVEDSEGQP